MHWCHKFIIMSATGQHVKGGAQMSAWTSTESKPVCSMNTHVPALTPLCLSRTFIVLFCILTPSLLDLERVLRGKTQLPLFQSFLSLVLLHCFSSVHCIDVSVFAHNCLWWLVCMVKCNSLVMVMIWVVILSVTGWNVSSRRFRAVLRTSTSLRTAPTIQTIRARTDTLTSWPVWDVISLIPNNIRDVHAIINKKHD